MNIFNQSKVHYSLRCSYKINVLLLNWNTVSKQKHFSNVKLQYFINKKRKKNVSWFGILSCGSFLALKPWSSVCFCHIPNEDGFCVHVHNNHFGYVYLLPRGVANFLWMKKKTQMKADRKQIVSSEAHCLSA